VHGSAPDIAGKGLVNPVAMFLTVALMLRELGFEAPAAALEAAVEGSVREGHTTRDLGGTMKTQDVTRDVLARLG